MDKSKKMQILTYIKSRKFVFLRIIVFLCLSGIFWYIGKLYRVTFFYTTRFFYPFFLILAMIQVWFLLPKWAFLKPRLKKVLGKVAKPFQKIWQFGKSGFEKIREKFFFGRKSVAVGKESRKKNKSYRDESFYAEGAGLFSKRRKHLKWRDMKSNNDKIRYLYMKYVLRGVKKGNPFQYSFTPMELQRLWKEKDEKIVSAYIQARYGNEELPEALVEELKEEQQKKINK